MCKSVSFIKLYFSLYSQLVNKINIEGESPESESGGGDGDTAPEWGWGWESSIMVVSDPHHQLQGIMISIIITVLLPGIYYYSRTPIIRAGTFGEMSVLDQRFFSWLHEIMEKFYCQYLKKKNVVTMAFPIVWKIIRDFSSL